MCGHVEKSLGAQLETTTTEKSAIFIYLIFFPVYFYEFIFVVGGSLIFAFSTTNTKETGMCVRIP